MSSITDLFPGRCVDKSAHEGTEFVDTCEYKMLILRILTN